VTFRPTVYGFDGMVAAPHHLAALAGANALRDGGSAIDAALAANLVMSVVWPHMCGTGGDLFAQVWSAADRRLFGLNGSGRAGAGMTPDAYAERGQSGPKMPARGPLSISVPGAVDGWFTLHKRWGRLEMPRVFRDAIHYAREGFAVSRVLSGAIRGNADLLRRVGGAADVFLRDGSGPRVGDRLVQSDLAATLDRVAREGPDVLYRGALGERIASYLGSAGSLLRFEDFASQRSEWVEPLSTEYRGVQVYELPPNTQGLAVLQMLNMLAPLDVRGLGDCSADVVDAMVERKRLAFADRDRYIADPAFADVPVARLLERSYTPAPARQAVAGARGGDGDTIYLCAADRDGNVVSLIQSLFSSFGSGVMVPGTGVTLHNRASGFVLERDHPNVLAPGKRPFHTLIPGFALRDGQPYAAFGTRGADGQPQTGVQVISQLFDFEADPQAALEAPRWVHSAPGDRFPQDALVLESRFGQQVADSLASRGHQVIVTDPLDMIMGTVQLIVVDPSRGCYAGASDPRGDGCALAV
jgi:gamma-glutamyltranspeptidase / glutathione hydrolase